MLAYIFIYYCIGSYIASFIYHTLFMYFLLRNKRNSLRYVYNLFYGIKYNGYYKFDEITHEYHYSIDGSTYEEFRAYFISNIFAAPVTLTMWLVMTTFCYIDYKISPMVKDK